MAEKIIKEDICEVMSQRYLDYAMSVILGRSLPDVRDGLKPVHRRILVGMNWLGLKPESVRKKAARAVGEVLGRLHPHGDSSVYDAMIRLGQPFVQNMLLTDVQGNIGSIDDPGSYAAMRYVEIKMAKVASEFLSDLPYETVDFRPNYDGSEIEPEVLPVSFPYFLTSCHVGISVGYATSILPYNLREVAEAAKELISSGFETPDDELLKIVKGPDFPTGGIVIERKGVVDAFKTGKGSIKVRSKVDVKDNVIVVTEIPYLVNKTALIDSIKEAATPTPGKKPSDPVKPPRIPEISEIRDVSSKSGVEVRISCKKGTNAEVVLNKLYKMTKLQETLSPSYVTIKDGKPVTVSFREAVDAWYQFRLECLHRKHTFLAKKAEDRIAILEGYLAVLEKDPEGAIKIIRGSTDTAEAKKKLMKKFGLNEAQVEAVLKLEVRRFAKSEVGKIKAELDEQREKYSYHNGRTEDQALVVSDIIDEIDAVAKKYGEDRRTEVESVMESGSFSEEDLVDREDTVMFLSADGYVKRVRKDAYTAQGRGGKGRKVGSRDGDYVTQIVSCSTHDDILFLTNTGKAKAVKAYKIPEAPLDKPGRHAASVVELAEGEMVTNAFSVQSYAENVHLITVTRSGQIKRTPLSDFNGARSSSGVIACKLAEGDGIVACEVVPEGLEANILVATTVGKVVHFGVEEIPVLGRVTYGNRAVTKGLEVCAAVLVTDLEKEVALISSGGLGKKTPLAEFPIMHRNTSGTIGMALREGADLTGMALVSEGDELMVVTKKGKTIRIREFDLPVLLRRTYGNKVISLGKEDRVVSLARIESTE